MVGDRGPTSFADIDMDSSLFWCAKKRTYTHGETERNVHRHMRAEARYMCSVCVHFLFQRPPPTRQDTSSGDARSNFFRWRGRQSPYVSKQRHTRRSRRKTTHTSTRALAPYVLLSLVAVFAFSQRQAQSEYFQRSKLARFTLKNCFCIVSFAISVCLREFDGNDSE